MGERKKRDNQPSPPADQNRRRRAGKSDPASLSLLWPSAPDCSSQGSIFSIRGMPGKRKPPNLQHWKKRRSALESGGPPYRRTCSPGESGKHTGSRGKYRRCSMGSTATAGAGRILVTRVCWAVLSTSTHPPERPVWMRRSWRLECTVKEPP